MKGGNGLDRWEPLRLVKGRQRPTTSIHCLVLATLLLSPANAVFKTNVASSSAKKHPLETL